MPLFINPNIHPKSQWSFVTARMALQPPMGIGFIAGYLMDKVGVPIRIVDEIIHPLIEEGLKQELRKLEHPKIVCLSSMTIQISRALELADMIKKIDRDVNVILGGIHPTVMPHEALERRSVDIVCRYEGEDTLVKIYNALKNKQTFKDIPGISFWDENGIHDNPAGPIVNLADSPLFHYDFFEQDIEYYNCFGSVSTSRGCPYNCIFCSNRTISGNRFRHFPLEWIEASLDILINKYKQNYIMFLDDVMFVDRRHFIAISEMIIKRGFHKKARFHGGARADTITPEIVKQCKRANFAFFGVGVESSSDRLLKILNKKETSAQIKSAIDLITKHGMMTSGAFIYGIPGETRDERRRSLKYAIRLPIDNARFNVIVPYPGTKLYEIAKKEGRLNVKEGYYNFNVQYYLFGDELPYVPEGTNRYELIFDTMWANMRYYLRWRTLTRMKKSTTTGGGTIHVPKKFEFKLYIDVFKFGMLVAGRFLKVGSIVLLFKLRKLLSTKVPIT